MCTWKSIVADFVVVGVVLVAVLQTSEVMNARYKASEPLLQPMLFLAGIVVFASVHLIRLGLLADPGPNGQLVVLGGVSLGVLAACLYVIQNGTVIHFASINKYAVRSDVSYVVMTAAAAECPLKKTRAHMREMSLEHNVVYAKADSAKFADSRETMRAFGFNDAFVRDAHAAYPRRLAHCLDAAMMLKKLSVENMKPWVVVVEDDFEPLPGFARKLERFLTAYDAYDIIWLDARNALPWVFLHRRVVGGMVAMAYKRESLAKIATMVRMDSPEFTQWLRGRDDYTSVQFDMFLADLCNSGVLRCAFAPLAVDTGVPSVDVRSV